MVRDRIIAVGVNVRVYGSGLGSELGPGFRFRVRFWFRLAFRVRLCARADFHYSKSLAEVNVSRFSRGRCLGKGSYVLHLSLVEVGDDGQPGSSPISALDDMALYSSGRPICSGFDSRPFHFQ